MSDELLRATPTELADQDELTKDDKQIAASIQQYSIIHDKLPNVDELSDYTGYTVEVIYATMAKPNFEMILSQLGMDTFHPKSHGVNPRKVLTPIQVMAANSVLNFHDKRTLRQKLGDFGIKTSTWNGWMDTNWALQEYVQKKAGGDLMKLDYITNVKLAEAVGEGDMIAIKLVKELTGKHTPRIQVDLNVGLLLTRLVEIIQVRVEDPSLRAIIANDVRELGKELMPGGV